MQVAALQDEEIVAALDARGIDAEPYLERLKPLLQTLEEEAKRGTGPKKGEARARRDEAQRRLEILLARGVSKISSVLGPAEANAFDAMLPRQHARRSSDAKPAVTTDPAGTVITNGVPDSAAVTVSTASVSLPPAPVSTAGNPGPLPDKPTPK